MKGHFSRFLGAAPGRLLFAAHSHHPWPDVSFEAQQQAWLDAARMADQKWDKVFDEVYPAAQAHVARILSLPDPTTVVFAPSTHELVMRLFSCLPARPRVLTTDSEFHSLSRQLKRLEEDERVEVTRIPTAPYESFAGRFAEAAAQPYDLVYFSQCFFNTGFRIEEPATLANAAHPDSTVAVDGYHSFMAQPTDWSKAAHRAFYLGGGYKYAMAGEGACFMHCPPEAMLRPVNTGWFASFGTLAKAQPGTVPYAVGGKRFMGATFDPTPLYRFNAVQEWLCGQGIDVAQIRARVERLQQRFLDQRQRRGLLPKAELMPPEGTERGNFLVLRHANAARWHRTLLDHDIQTDCRDDRLRIGFGLYHDSADVDALVERATACGLA